MLACAVRLLSCGSATDVLVCTVWHTRRPGPACAATVPFTPLRLLRRQELHADLVLLASGVRLTWTQRGDTGPRISAV